jgi:pimeloyl-ACP methyl ester carboxylesterase
MNTLVNELETLLVEAGESGPFVLAGHSFGGVIALSYANRNPEAVSGVVLIDSSHPDQMTALEAVPEVVAVQDMEIAGLGELVGAAEAGMLPAEAVIAGAPPVLSPALQQTWAELFVTAKQLRAMVAEYAVIDDALSQARNSVDIGSTPLIVLSRGIGLEGQLPAEALDALGLTPDVLRRFDGVWSDLQADLATLSTESKRVVAERSNHYVYYGQPELVEAAIRELVREARVGTIGTL